MRIICCDFAVSIQICCLQIQRGAVLLADHIIQNGLCIIGIGIAIAIHVCRNTEFRYKLFSVDRIDHLRGQRRRCGMQIQLCVRGSDCLREEIAGQ